MLHYGRLQSYLQILDKAEWRYDIQNNDIQHNDTQHKGIICDTRHKWHSAWMALSIMALDTECHYAECHDLFFIILNDSMLSVIILNVVAQAEQYG